MELKKERKFTRIERLKHSARRRSINEGVFATIKGSLGESYVTPFAIAINASNFLIGIFSSLSGLLGPLSQWQSSRLIEKYKRKNIVVKSVFLESITWLPLAILAFLFYKGIIVSTLPFVLLLFFSLYIIFANASGPAWFSWVGDLVKEDYRGEWFAKRNFKIGIATFISTLAAAFFLDFMKSKEMIMFGFIIMFLIAMVARLISCYLFTKTYEPKLNLKKGYYFSFWEFIKKAPHNNFGRFVIFRAALNFAICIGSPFFAVYMLRDLQFNYITYILIILAPTAYNLLTIRLFGKFSDKYGNYALMKITALLVSIFPVFWVFSKNPAYLFCVPELMSGIGWAGFNLAASNYIYDSVTPQRRGICVSYYNLLNGIGVFLGAGLGALLVKYIDIKFMNLFLFIFLISAIARILVVYLMLGTIKEVRKTSRFSYPNALKFIMLYPTTHSSGNEQLLSFRKRFFFKK